MSEIIVPNSLLTFKTIQLCFGKASTMGVAKGTQNIHTLSMYARFIYDYICISFRFCPEIYFF